MGWSPTVFTAAGLAAAVVAGWLAVVGWRARSEPYADAFTALMVALGVWGGTYGIQLGFDTIGEAVVWQRLATAAGAGVPTLWFLFAARYAGLDDRFGRPGLVALAVEPIAFGGLALTNPSHELIWRISRVDGAVQQTTLTVAGDVHAVYNYVLTTAGILALVAVAVGGSVVYRRQATLLVAGAVVPFVANVAFFLGIGPAVDLTPFALVLTGVVWGIGLFELDLLNRAPVAHRRAITEVGDGLVVFDGEGRVVHVDGVADAVFDPEPRVGRHVTALRADGGVGRVRLPVEERTTDPETSDAARPDESDAGTPTPGESLATLDGTTRTAVVDGRERAYDMRVSTIRDHHDQRTGWVLVVRDVTRREAYQQRLEVANRVLRHNLRNDMNVVAGNARIVEDRIGAVEEHPDPGTEEVVHLDAADAAEIREAAVTIRETAAGLLATSEKARQMAALPEIDREQDPTELVEPTRATVRELRDRAPDATITVDAPASVTAVVGGTERYRTALRNLLDNAIEHHDGTPHVTVELVDDDPVRVIVADDGPGLPAEERRTFAAGRETDLQHASGLGLWLVYWVTTGVGGDLSFADREPRGTVVTMSFPAGED